MLFYKRTGRTETEDNRCPKMSKSKVYNQSTSSVGSLPVSVQHSLNATNKAPEECNVSPPGLPSPVLRDQQVPIKIQLRHQCGSCEFSEQDLAGYLWIPRCYPKHSRHNRLLFSFISLHSEVCYLPARSRRAAAPQEF